VEELYLGIRVDGTCVVVVVEACGNVRELGESRRSPRFPSRQWEWGYGGTGPAELAWALVYDATGDEALTRLVYQGVKWGLISSLNRAGWVLTKRAVLEAAAHEGRRKLASEQEEGEDEAYYNGPDEMIDLGAGKPRD
jgi:hypothetical protein